MTMKPRRRGTIQEFQNGHYFLYLTEWEAEEDGSGRRHREIEIYYAKANPLDSSDDPIWNSTDPNIFERALSRFFEDPSGFKLSDHTGRLPGGSVRT